MGGLGCDIRLSGFIYLGNRLNLILRTIYSSLKWGWQQIFSSVDFKSSKITTQGI